MEEREIDLFDLLIHLLSHWRGILVCMLAGALLLGGFSYERSYRRAGAAQGEQGLQNDAAASEARLRELEEQLTDTEKAAVYSVIDDEREYATYRQYRETSLLMQMDSFKIPKVEMIYRIQGDDMGQSSTLKSVYEDLVNGVGLFQWVEEQTGISSACAGELILTQKKADISATDAALITAPGSVSLKVIVIHVDESECERLAQCVKDYIEQQHNQLTREVGAHEVVLLSESAGIVMDTGVMDRQLSYSNTEITLLTNCAKVKDAFTEAQQTYYDMLKAADESAEEIGEPEAAAEQAKVTPSVSKKYVLFGAVLFAFAYAGILFVIYILNGKLRAGDELQSLYNIPQLGLIVKGGGKKFFVDRWIDALRNRNKRRFTGEQSLELAAAAIKISAGKQNLDTVCLMGCDLKAGADVVCEELKERLAKENISVKILDNVLYDAQAMAELENVRGIVLVEKAMSTMYQEIARELELTSRQGIQVLGGIVVE